MNPQIKISWRTSFIAEKNQDSLENYENLRIPRPWEDQTEVDFMRHKNRQVKSIKEIKEEHKKPAVAN